MCNLYVAMLQPLVLQRLLFLAALVLASCTTSEFGAPQDDYSDLASEVVTLEGSELSSELRTSPAHETRLPFRRIGVLWDSTESSAIEVSTSADGFNWSNWVPFTVHHVEMAESGAFVGQHEVSGPMATHYKIRGSAESVSYARFEVIVKSASQSIEDGEDGSEGDGAFLIRAETGVDMLSRSEWGARQGRCTKKSTSTNRMTLHHTMGPANSTIAPAARIRQIQSYHMDVHGWCDIGYHYLVSANGQVWEGRSSLERGAHTANNNEGNLGIAVVGNYDRDLLPNKGVKVLGALVSRLALIHSIDIGEDFRSHAAYGSLLCPGESLNSQVPEIRAVAKNTEDDRTGDGDDESGDDEGDGQGDNEEVTDRYSVAGVIYQGSDTGRYVSEVTVKLGDEVRVTDSTGYFEFEDVRAGGFQLSAEKVGYQEREISRATTGEETWVSFGMSEVVDQSPSAVLHGVVHYSADTTKRIPDAMVSLSSGISMRADANGYFKFTGLPAGPIDVRVSAPGYEDGRKSLSLIAGETEWGGIRLTADGSGGGGGGGNSLPGQACFPGANGAGTTCLPLVETNAYSYPSGSGNYTRPMRFLDLDAVDLNVNISANFKLSEISARRKGKYQVVQPHAIRKLQQLRNNVGHALTVNSGFRSPTYNSSIGGATKSRHMYGDAFDIMPGATGREGLMQKCRDLGAGYVAKYANSGHIHCDWRSDPLDSSFYGISNMLIEDDSVWSVRDLRAEIVFVDGEYLVEASGYDEQEGQLARDWIAYDVMGNVVAEVEAMSFQAPEETHTVQVNVGGLMEVEMLAEERELFYE